MIMCDQSIICEIEKYPTWRGPIQSQWRNMSARSNFSTSLESMLTIWPTELSRREAWLSRRAFLLKDFQNGCAIGCVIFLPIPAGWLFN